MSRRIQDREVNRCLTIVELKDTYSASFSTPRGHEAKTMLPASPSASLWRPRGEKSALSWATQSTKRSLALKPYQNQGFPSRIVEGAVDITVSYFSIRLNFWLHLLFQDKRWKEDSDVQPREAKSKTVKRKIISHLVSPKRNVGCTKSEKLNTFTPPLRR